LHIDASPNYRGATWRLHVTQVVNRIEKSIDVHAPRPRVWRALADADPFAHWFGLALDGPIEPGARREGRMVGTAVDAEVGRAQREHAGLRFEIVVERVEPERLMSFRWHPGAVDATVDYSAEPMTLVEFTLTDIPGGTRVTVTESGFDGIPIARRAAAFTGNDQGWTVMIGVLGTHLSRES
jgi:uncharacterized protein YndB with AHSA1/START domain